MTTGERILQALPATRAELLESLPMSPSTLHKWVTRLRDQEQAHIGSWRRTQGDLAPVLHAGPGRDAKRPKALAHAQVQRRYVQSLKAAGVYEDVLADQRRRNARRKPPSISYTRDPLMSALFGR